MIQKPGKPVELAESYKPISLLPVLSKLFEKLLLSRLLEIIERQKIIPNHQFGFQHRHATIEQMHRIVKKINIEMDAGRYCTAAFLDVSQAFDKVWHAGILHKIKSCFPSDLYAIIKSYLLQRTFRVKFGEMVMQLKDINSGVSQGSVLGPVLYLLYTLSVDLAIALDITATYADDTTILAAHKDHIEAISAFTRKPSPHPDMAKEMENQSQWDKICTGDFHPQKDVPTSNLERREDSSNRERVIFEITFRSQTKL